MATCGHDILRLNVDIKVILDLMKVRGETTNDPPTNIFRGKLCAPIKYLSIASHISRKDMRKVSTSYHKT